MYQQVEECPSPYVGLEWTECLSYYGRVVAKVNRTMSFRWQLEDEEWSEALNEDYFVIEDTGSKLPYILTEKQFKEKFSCGGIKGCWVRFKLKD